MKSNKGITLVTLIVIVAVVIIIASVGISTGISALNSTRLKGFYTQLEIVQKRVDEISANDEYYIDGRNNKVYLSEQGNDLTTEQLNKLKEIITAEGGDSTESYVNYFRYFTKEQVKTILGIEDIDYNLFINFEERIIIAEDGIQIGKKTYYMLQSATYFVKHKSQTPSDVDFTVSATKLTDGYYKISIVPTETETTVTIKYKSIFTKYWERTNELEIKVTGDLPQYFDITYRSLSKNKSTTKCYGIYLDADKNVKVTLVNKLYVAGDLLSIETQNSTDETIPDEITSYVLMNDITFTPSSYNEESQYYNKVYSGTYGYYWKPIGEVTIANSGKFDGNNKEIHVTYTDSDGADYTVTYNKENNYSEPEYEFNIITYLKDGESRTKTEELGIETTIKNVTKDVNLDGTTVTVKRGAPNAIQVQAIPKNQITYKSSNEATIKAENPSKINKDVELEITYRYVTVKFYIKSTQDENKDLCDTAKLTLTINGTSKEYGKSDFYNNGIKVIAGKEIKYTAECTGYETIKDGTYTPTADDNQIRTIDMKIKKVNFKIVPYSEYEETISPMIKIALTADGLEEKENNIIEVQYGKSVYYKITLGNYNTATGTVDAKEGKKENGEVKYIAETDCYEYHIKMEPIYVSLIIKVKNVDKDGDALIAGDPVVSVDGYVIENPPVHEDDVICYTKDNFRAGTTVKIDVKSDWYTLSTQDKTIEEKDTIAYATLIKNIVEYYVGPTGYDETATNCSSPKVAMDQVGNPHKTNTWYSGDSRTTTETYYTWVFDKEKINNWPVVDNEHLLLSIEPVYKIDVKRSWILDDQPDIYAKFSVGSSISRECSFLNANSSAPICLIFDSDPDKLETIVWIEYKSMALNRSGDLTLGALKTYGAQLYVKISPHGLSIVKYYGASIRFEFWEK